MCVLAWSGGGGDLMAQALLGSCRWARFSNGSKSELNMLWEFSFVQLSSLIPVGDATLVGDYAHVSLTPPNRAVEK
jgi:hypothetical protein